MEFYKDYLKRMFDGLLSVDTEMLESLVKILLDVSSKGGKVIIAGTRETKIFMRNWGND